MIIEPSELNELLDRHHDLGRDAGRKESENRVRELENRVRELESRVSRISFDIISQMLGPDKIQAIKAVREVTKCGLKEAKDLVDAGAFWAKQP